MPDWLRELPLRAAAMEPSWYSRFLPDGSSTRRSAVLILFGPGPGPSGTDPATGEDVLLTERPRHMRKHPSQVSFPGGGAEPGDADAVATALREAHEEVDLDPAAVEVVACLPELTIPVSRNDVSPVVAWAGSVPPVRAADPMEVARAVRVPLAQLADPERRCMVKHPRGHLGPGFDLPDDLFIWGFTAGLLDKLLRLGGLARPWDQERQVSLPERFLPGAGPTVLSGETPPPPRTATGW